MRTNKLLNCWKPLFKFISPNIWLCITRITENIFFRRDLQEHIEDRDIDLAALVHIKQSLDLLPQAHQAWFGTEKVYFTHGKILQTLESFVEADQQTVSPKTENRAASLPESVIIFEIGLNSVNPAVAYNAQRDQYLVVWYI